MWARARSCPALGQVSFGRQKYQSLTGLSGRQLDGVPRGGGSDKRWTEKQRNEPVHLSDIHVKISGFVVSDMATLLPPKPPRL